MTISMTTPRSYRSVHLLPTLLAATVGVAGIGASDRAAAFELEPQARLHLDYAVHDADAEVLDDDLIVRRAKVGLEGKFNDDWSFEIEYALADDGRLDPDQGELEDVVVEYEGWSVGDISLGQFKIPFGLAEATSSNDITLIERPLPVDAFTLSRRMGVGFARETHGYSVRAMAFGSSISGGDRGRGAAARITLAPIHDTDTVLHFGMAAVTEDPHINEVDFDTAPESRPAGEDLVNTGDFGHVRRVNRFGLEAAWRTGPFSVQSEWMQVAVDRDAPWTDASFDGWYVSGSWVLTGEMRRYDGGEFKGIEPGPGGAWELTARVSRINLDDGDIRGGEERNITVGLNYYLNKHLRFMANYIRVHSERHGQADDPSILLLRAQWVL